METKPKSNSEEEEINMAKGQHHYTTDMQEAKKIPTLPEGWRLEGIAYYIWPDEADDRVALHRFARHNGGHLFTLDQTEGENAGLVYEGIAGYIYDARNGLPAPAHDHTVQVCRLYSGGEQDDDHFYTASGPERQAALSHGFVDEGTPYFWAVGGAVDGAQPAYRFYLAGSDFWSSWFGTLLRELGTAGLDYILKAIFSTQDSGTNNPSKAEQPDPSSVDGVNTVDAALMAPMPGSRARVMTHLMSTLGRKDAVVQKAAVVQKVAAARKAAAGGY